MGFGMDLLKMAIEGIAEGYELGMKKGREMNVEALETTKQSLLSLQQAFSDLSVRKVGVFKGKKFSNYLFDLIYYAGLLGNPELHRRLFDDEQKLDELRDTHELFKSNFEMITNMYQTYLPEDEWIDLNAFFEQIAIQVENAIFSYSSKGQKYKSCQSILSNILLSLKVVLYDLDRIKECL